MGLFEGLASLGFDTDKIDDTEIFKTAPKPGSKQGKKSAEKVVEEPINFLYAKEFSCPVCGKTFTSFLIRKSKLRLINSDTDLKANYDTIDPNHYDVLLCSFCGYAALTSYFNRINDRQIDLIEKKIKSQFTPKEYPVPLSKEHAVERYKMALLCAVIKGAKSGEKAIICLKTAWIYRDLGDTTNEKLFLQNAYTGFKDAYSTETFPIGSMDENTTQFLIGELARRIGDFGEAAKWIGGIIIRRDIPKNLKDRAAVVRDLIHEETAKQ